MNARAFGIAETASLFGVSSRTLQLYESRGLLSPAKIGTTRFYSARDRIRLELILKGERLGFSLSEIERLLAALSTMDQVANSETRKGGSRDLTGDRPRESAACEDIPRLRDRRSS